MNYNERTQDIYEHIPGYSQPPLIPLIKPDDDYKKNPLGLKLSPLMRFYVNTVLSVTGFNRFFKKLPNSIENLLRRTNLRGPALFAPVVSATLAMQDDARNPVPVDRAVSLLLGAYSLHKDIQSAKLPPDKYKDNSLEMGQYPNLFSTGIILEDSGPRLFKSTCYNQFTVSIANRLYLIKVEDWESDNIQEQLKNAFLHLIEQHKSFKPEDEIKSPGILTAANDIIQLRAFKMIRQNSRNKDSLEAIRHSFLTICFDLQDHPQTISESALKTHSTNYANRWNHASLQLIVFGNSKAAAICNFSTYIDGNTMVRAVAEIQKRSLNISIPQNEDTGNIPAAETIKLEWEINSLAIQKAQQDLKSITDSQQATFTIDGFGRDFFKSHNIAAIPAFIIALEYAAKKITGRCRNIAQFLSISKYRCMDLTTTMVSTPEVCKFVDAVDSDDIGVQNKLSLLNDACDSQIEQARIARKQIPFNDLIELFRKTRTGIKKPFANIPFLIMFAVLQKSGAMRHLRREIVVSHPIIYPEVPIVGRPGVRLPYTTLFGLHYQIFSDKIVITMMPGIKWEKANPEVVEAIEEGLKKIEALFLN